MSGWCLIDSVPGRGTKVELALAEAPQAAPPLPGPAPKNPEPHLPAPSRWRVLLVDDHAMVRQGLRNLLETYPDLEVVAEAADGEHAVEYATRFHPDVVLIDVNLPATQRYSCHATHQAGYAAHSRAIDALLAAGAAAILSKELAADDL